jgi:hypothetical protein
LFDLQRAFTFCAFGLCALVGFRRQKPNNYSHREATTSSFFKTMTMPGRRRHKQPLKLCTAPPKQRYVDPSDHKEKIHCFMKSSAIHKLAGRLPHLWAKKPQSAPH